MSGKLLFSFLILNIHLNKNVASSMKIKYNDIIKTFQTLESLDRLKYLNTTKLCRNHLTEYANGLKSEQYWALQMYDSNPKIPYSLLTGNRRILGNYDECVEVEHPDHQFTGQHCMLTADITVDIDENVTRKKVTDQNQKSTPLTFSMCVPSTCTPEDVMRIVNTTINDTLSEFLVTLNQDDCQTKNVDRKLRPLDWIVIVILIGFGIIAFASTIYDIYQNFYLENAKPHPLLISFSIYSNGKNLFKIDKNPEHMKAIDGIKVWSTYWVILLHIGTITEDFSFNPWKELTIREDASQLEFIEGYLAVDTFFVLSGMLVCMVFFRNINKKGYFDIPVQLIHRYIRLTPSYAAQVLIIVSILKYMGDGPMWFILDKALIGPCKRNWWTGILYLSTLTTIISDICNVPSWYIATDMQLHFFSPLVLVPLYLWPLSAASFLGLVISLSACASFGIAYCYDLDASIKPPQHERMVIDYTRFYTNSSPYLIGIAVGYIITQIRAGKMTLKLRKVHVFGGWLLSTLLCLGVLYGILPFQKARLSTLENSLYLSLYRVAWGFGIAWIVFACVNGYGGFINKFLSWNFFQPLSRLSYNTYLLQSIVFLYRFGNMRTNVYLGNVEIVFNTVSIVVMCNLLAIPFTLLFEMPFGNLDSYFFRNVKILPYPKRRIEEQEKEIEMEESNFSAQDRRQSRIITETD